MATSLSWIVEYIVLTSLLILCADILRRHKNFQHYKKLNSVILELTPPAFARKTPLATEQLFQTLHSLGSAQTLRERLLDRGNRYSFEVVSSRSAGIRFMARMKQCDVAIFQQQLAAYMPDVKFAVVPDYLPELVAGKQTTLACYEFKQGGHFAFPLAAHDALIQHDPIAYITGSMTKLAPSELIAYQVVLSPANKREVTRIRNKLYLGKDPDLYGKNRTLGKKALVLMLQIPFIILSGILGLIGSFFDDTSYHSKSNAYKAPVVPQRAPEHQELLATLGDKLKQPLFHASIRVLVVTDDRMKAGQSIQGLSSALGLFSVPGFQSLIAKRNFPRSKMNVHRLHSFASRWLPILMRHSSIVSVSEVASLYHFPFGETARPENLARSQSRTLPAPFALKARADEQAFDVVLGENQHHGSTNPIGLLASERQQHVYVIGGTGNGKTTMLQYAIVQDMRAGKGVAVIDPHGDMAQTLLTYVPKDRIDDVVYLNPVNIDYPIGINVLELPTGLSGSQLLLEKERVTEAVISILRKVFSDDANNAHRIEGILRNAIHTAISVEVATLFTVLKILRNTNYRKTVVAQLTDEHLRDFWKEEFGQAGDMQRVSLSKGVTNRIDRFRSSKPAERMLEQAHSTISFEDIIDSGKILICNFAEGNLGEDTSALFGTTILAKLKLAAERRARMSAEDRQPFYLYVDEFQNFATTPFVKMLSSSRKYKLFLALAQQSTSQQDEQRLTETILSNVSTVVCFRTGSPADEQLILPRFSPFIEQGEIGNLPAYHYYIRVQAQESLEPMSGVTLQLDDDWSEDVADAVAEASRKNYALQYVEMQPEQKLAKPNTGRAAKTTHKKSSGMKKPVKHKSKATK